MEITVGYAAGFIALALFIVQLWCPTIVTFILASILRDKETAATWSVAARAVLSSHWPFMLRAESSSRSHVRTAVYLASISLPTITVITAVTSVVTPIGLYEDVRPSRKITTPTFAYAGDPSAFGLATGPRLNHTFTRTCGFPAPVTCPGETDVSVLEGARVSQNGSYPFGLKTRVSDSVISVFSSGTSGARTTVSNFFDIEWRQLTWVRSLGADPVYDNGTARSAGRFQQIDSSILQNEYKVVEGLVVDAKDGGLGFRNHTLPTGLPLGAEWTEDLLFIEPQTECVNTNLTIEFTVTTETTRSINKTVGASTGIRDLVLTDRGGFSELNRTYPFWPFDRDNSQSNPELRMRAYKAAWLSNVYAALVLNVTNSLGNTNYSKSWSYMTSSMNKTFPLSVLSSVNDDQYNKLSITTTFGDYLNFLDLSRPEVYPNPEKVTRANFSSINILCEGAGAGDRANYTNIITGCFQLRGAPTRVDGGYEGTLEAGSRWTSPILTCATALKASIKTVRFQTDGHSTNISTLRATHIAPKEYASPDKYPIWGIENSNAWLRDVVPIWGIISKAYENLPGIKALRQPSIYLPGSRGALSANTGSLSSLQMEVNLPAAQFPFASLDALSTDDAVYYGYVADYTGVGSMSMLQRWRELGRTAETAGQIINLIWTDISTSAVCGSRGVLGRRNAEPPEAHAKIHVRPVRRQVRYRLAFAIPALILAVIALLVTVVAGVIACFRGARIRHVHRALRQSSTGRLVTSLIGPPGESDLKMGSKEWSVKNGAREVDLSSLVPLMVSGLKNDSDSGWGDQDEFRGGASSDGYSSLKERPAVTVTDTTTTPLQQYDDDGTGYVYNGQNNQGYAAVSSSGVSATTSSTVTPDPPAPPQVVPLQWVMYQGEPYLYYPHQTQNN